METKLDFDDVLIHPQRSALSSRGEFNHNKLHKFRWTGNLSTKFPVIASNMYNTGTFAMATALHANGMLTALHKFYPAEQLIEFFNSNPECADSVFYSMGMTEGDVEKFRIVQDGTFMKVKMVCLDVANGYMQAFVDFVAMMRERFPYLVIAAGNVVSANMTEALILAGADIVKVGIGSGCFIRGTKINTESGLKNIEKVKVGDNILTHTREYKKVIALHQRLENEKIIDINGIKCTSNHEFYVVNKKDKDNINNENIHKYAKWVSAEELNEEWLLVKIAE